MSKAEHEKPSLPLVWALAVSRHEWWWRETGNLKTKSDCYLDLVCNYALCNPRTPDEQKDLGDKFCEASLLEIIIRGVFE
jgi:hypothetical protein